MHKFRAPGGAVASNWVINMDIPYFHPSGVQNIELASRIFEHFCTPGLRDHLN